MSIMLVQGRCLECSRMVEDLPLKTDPVLALIRFFKAKVNWGVAKEPVVLCRDEKCVASHKKKLAHFHKSFALYSSFGLILGLVIIFVRPTVASFISGLAVALFVSCLSLFNYYPDVERESV